ncbi:Dihydrofolate reductase [Pseudooceanicola batsensis HTCC2597]|uniref:Dihydrofolate reductase n=2 Tax=Pseudooceanicola batsensis TaxID=314255 RepID=A3TYY0_PSEBH|nr:Dihydrofolate reductase [Pseudooceanicola batsensis HTCC2597]
MQTSRNKAQAGHHGAGDGMITLVVARDRNGAIGKDGGIPWHLPGDLKMFQRETTGGALIMGRHTWESLPAKPLNRRLNIVVTSRPDTAKLICETVGEAVRLAEAEGYFRIYGIGGAGIYRDMLPLADRLLVTEVETAVENADTFFPEFDEEEWQETTRATAAGDPGYAVRELIRKRGG